MSELTNNYTAEDFTILSDIDHVKLRSGMYIGEATDPHQLFLEALDNAVDELGECGNTSAKIYVDTKLNKYTVADSGRGIPHGKKLLNGEEKEIVEINLVKLNSGGKFNRNGYKKSCGLHGMGDTLINALSTDVELESIRDGESVKIVMHNSEKVSLDYTKKEGHGTIISFIPDPQYFITDIIPFDIIYDRCRILKSFGLDIELYKDNELIEIPNSDSIFDLMPVEEKFYLKEQFKFTSSSDEDIIVAIQYSPNTKYRSIGYTNYVYNRLGGNHCTRVHDAICEVWSEFTKNTSVELKYDDCTLGLDVLTAVFIGEISFSSQTKEKLTTYKAYFDELINGFKEQFRKYLLDNDKLRDALIKRFVDYRVSQNKLMNQKEIMSLVKINDQVEGSPIRRRSVVKNLIECTSSKRDDTELAIVEGNSAAGGPARSRDKRTQAVLPLRGKIQNVTYMSIKDALKHETVLNIVNSIGAGVGENSDPSKCRYERIIILADGDPDGCWAGSTKIRSLDGKSYTFEELVNNNIEELWVYSKDEDGKVVPALATSPRITKYVDEVLELEFSNGYKVRCTPDHRILLNSGEYVEASKLSPDDEISSVYFDYDKREYLRFWDDGSERYIPVHTMVNKFFHSDEMDNLLDNIPESYSTKDAVLVTHHISCDKRNNTPDNLKWMYWKDHSEYHKYLGHVTGKITGPRNIIAYNKSEKKRAQMRELWKTPEFREAHSASLVRYNKSSEHREQLSNMNSSDEVKLLQMRGKILKVISCMLANDIEVNEENYRDIFRKVSMAGIPKWSNIEKYFSPDEDLIELAKDKEPAVLRESYNTYPHNSDKKLKVRIAHLINNLKVKNLEINEENYNNERTSKFDPRWDNILNYFNSHEEAIEYASVINHRIVSSKLIKLEEPIPVYDMTVDKYHNFMIEVNDEHTEGIIVHNCHITALVTSVMINLLPNLVKAGMVYILEAPLYGYTYNGVRHYTNELDTIPDDCTEFTRYKGLGEMDDREFKESCWNKDNRRLTRLIYPDDVDKFNEILGTSSGRSNLLKDLGLLIQVNPDNTDELELSSN